MYTIQQNIGVQALDRVMYAAQMSPYDQRLTKHERDLIVGTIRPLEQKHELPFNAVRMLLRSSRDNDITLHESIFVTTTGEHGIDVRDFDRSSLNLMSVLQYASLFKAGLTIDPRPPMREIEKPFVRATDHGDVWTSTVLNHPTRKNALYTGLVRNGLPSINVISPDRVHAQRTVLKSHEHIEYKHPYRVRPVIPIRY